MERAAARPGRGRHRSCACRGLRQHQRLEGFRTDSSSTRHRPLSLLAGEFKLWDRGGLDLAVGRLLLLSEALALLLVLLISTLLYAQLRLICANVLTVEQIRWHRQHPGESAPSRGQPGWSEYAPYDLGSNWRCLVGFARGERGCDGAGLVRAAAEAGSSRVEKAV